KGAAGQGRGGREVMKRWSRSADTPVCSNVRSARILSETRSPDKLGVAADRNVRAPGALYLGQQVNCRMGQERSRCFGTLSEPQIRRRLSRPADHQPPVF